MSFLAPLYLLGGLAIVAPILWHLIRRRPKTQMPFSTLMFLQPSPPRITRRSRLENLPLLLLRILALLLLALAFARPLFRSASETAMVPEGRRVVVMIDTSASMQRDGLWEAAQKKVREIIADLGAEDSVAVIAFDDQPRVVWSFDESSRLTPTQRASHAETLVTTISPGWFATDLGAAISFAGDYARQRNDEPSTEHPAASESIPTQLHLVSDLQSGSDVSMLQAYAWPDDSRLDLHRVEPANRDNASVRVLGDAGANESVDDQVPDANQGAVRVRVANQAGASTSTFTLAWDSQAPGNTSPLATQVPPGESRVVRMPMSEADARSLRLSGDRQNFDNEWFVVPPKTRKSTVLYLGKSVDDRRTSLLYYVQQIPLSDRYHEITLERRDPESLVAPPDAESLPLVIVGEPPATELVGTLATYLNSGGRVLWVLDNPAVAGDDAQALQQLTGQPQLEVREASVADYAMFAKIDFAHELFKPLADARFNDFSKIRTWSYRQLANFPDAWRRLIDFDSRDPALVEVTVGEGRLWILAFGWQPQSSQLALSTKFIPLMLGMVRSRESHLEATTDYLAGEYVPNELEADEDSAWMTSDGRFAKPGVFRSGDTEFAVNVAPAESETEPMPLESLERMGIRMGSSVAKDDTMERERRIQDTELERRQSLWQWAIACVLGLVGLETVLSGLKSRPQAS